MDRETRRAPGSRHGGPRCVLTQPHRGAAAARNAGIQAAHGRFVALGDRRYRPRTRAGSRAITRATAPPDTILLVVIGIAAWHRRIRVTPFLRYLNEQGRWVRLRADRRSSRDLPFYFSTRPTPRCTARPRRPRAVRRAVSVRRLGDTEFAYRLKRRDSRIGLRGRRRASRTIIRPASAVCAARNASATPR